MLLNFTIVQCTNNSLMLFCISRIHSFDNLSLSPCAVQKVIYVLFTCIKFTQINALIHHLASLLPLLTQLDLRIQTPELSPDTIRRFMTGTKSALLSDSKNVYSLEYYSVEFQTAQRDLKAIDLSIVLTMCFRNNTLWLSLRCECC